MTRAVVAALAAGFMIWHAEAGEPFQLELPVQCEIGRDCFVQQYVDIDPGPEVKDYACGQQSYDGHKGTDIRVRSTADVARNVAILAAAGGVVKGRRDGMADRLVKSRQVPDGMKGRECGNGVLIEHQDGWETQYCHMRRGSVRVHKGDTVRAGDVIGMLGYSGLAGFAHVEFVVRKDGKVIDPFKGPGTGGEACGAGDQALWPAPVLAAFSYRKGQVLNAGFAAGKVTLDEVESGAVQRFVPTPDAPAIVAWGWAINLQKGDEVIVILAGPGGKLRQNRVTLKNRKSQYMLFAGKKREADRWPSGRYTSFFGVLRGGKPIIRAARPYVMP